MAQGTSVATVFVFCTATAPQSEHSPTPTVAPMLLPGVPGADDSADSCSLGILSGSKQVRACGSKCKQLPSFPVLLSAGGLIASVLLLTLFRFVPAQIPSWWAQS